MREVKLPSGAILKVTPSPFPEAKELYKAVLRELRSISVSSKTEMNTLYKELFCVGFSSDEIEAKLWKCFERCLYNDSRISADTFEKVEARDDYMSVCMEVAKENVGPFGKSLFAEYQRFMKMTESAHESK